MERKFDLEDRTERFSLRVRDLCKLLKQDVINREYILQLVRAAGSVGANYIEANDKLGGKDLRFRIRISKKEAKESIYWLKHITTSDEKHEEERLLLMKEAEELMRIFAAILIKLGD